MGIKLDISKTYDTVEWIFVEAVMNRMRFLERWITLIMVCLRTVSYPIVVNGQLVGNIQPTRGIHQGDPISPYIFLLRAEALSSMLAQVENNGSITGVPIFKHVPRISHIFFADDSLMSCKANAVE